MRWIGLGIASIGLIAGASLGGSIGSFINIPSVLFVLIVGGGITVSAHGVAGLGRMLRAFCVGTSASDAGRIRPVAETAQQAFIAAGWLGIIVGVVQMLSTLDDPAMLGQGGAVAILTVLYGYILAYVICMPLARSFTEVSEQV